MIENKIPFRGIALMMACVPFFAGCQNPAYQRAISTRDAQIQRLRDDCIRHKEDLQMARAEADELSVRLADASMRPEAEPAAQPQLFPGLESLSQYGVPVGVRDGRIVITLPAAITFGSGKSELTKSGGEALRGVASELKREFQGSRFFIEGHTDDEPIRKSSFGSNRELSIARAMAVLSYLVSEECQIPDEDCVIVGRGQYDPVAANSSASNKALNRRVEIVVHSAGE